jgi:transcription initiation factor TFIIF subunit beta
MAQVKPDPDAMYIKEDPDSKDTVLADIDDDDLYEDAGDLDFTAAAQNVWMSRLPRQLWEHWSQLDDDEEIEIGTVRIEGDANDLKRVRSKSHVLLHIRDSDNSFTLRSACGFTSAQITKTFPKTTHSNNKRSTP